MLRAVATYGGGLSFSGDTAPRRNAADRLIKLGYLRGGDYRHVWSFTRRGEYLWNRITAREAANRRKAFEKEQKEFEG